MPMILLLLLLLLLLPLLVFLLIMMQMMQMAGGPGYSVALNPADARKPNTLHSSTYFTYFDITKPTVGMF
jgi:hypothetical protein